MSTERTTSRTTTGPTRETRLASRLIRGFRPALLVFVVAAGCYVAYGIGRLGAEWRQSTQPADALAATTFDPNSLAPVLPLDGPWSFAQLDWSIRSRMIPSAEVAGHFEALAASPVGTSDEQLPDVSQDLVELAGDLHVEPVERDGNLVYRVERKDLVAQLVTRVVAGKTKAVALAAAFPTSGEQWQLFEGTPSPTAKNSGVPEQHLLPLPADARRSGSRCADDGRLLLELVSLESTAEELLAQWKEAGWEIRPAGLSSPEDFGYLCARGDEVIYAWSSDGHGPLDNLMLVRTSSPADTGP